MKNEMRSGTEEEESVLINEMRAGIEAAEKGKFKIENKIGLYRRGETGCTMRLLSDQARRAFRRL